MAGEETAIISEPSVEKVFTEQTEKNKRIVQAGLELHTYQGGEIKNKVDTIAGEITERQKNIKLIHEIIQTCNRLTAEENGIDFKNEPELLEKIRKAKEFGVEIVEHPEKLSASESVNFIKNLHMNADDIDQENKTAAQKMHTHIQEYDRLGMILNLLLSTEERVMQKFLDRR